MDLIGLVVSKKKKKRCRRGKKIEKLKTKPIQGLLQAVRSVFGARARAVYCHSSRYCLHTLDSDLQSQNRHMAHESSAQNDNFNKLLCAISLP